MAADPPGHHPDNRKITVSPQWIDRSPCTKFFILTLSAV